MPDAKRSDRTAHALILSTCRRFHAGEQAALGQGPLGEQLVEKLDAACGMETLFERIVQVARVQSGIRTVRTQLLQRTHDLTVRFRQRQAFHLGDFLGLFTGPVEGGMGIHGMGWVSWPGRSNSCVVSFMIMCLLFN